MLPSHAMQRALERCPGVCPGALIRMVSFAVREKNEAVVRFVGRIRKEDFRSLFYLRLATGEPRYAVCNPVTGYVITFLKPGREIWMEKGKYMLGEEGLETIPRRSKEEIEV